MPAHGLKKALWNLSLSLRGKMRTKIRMLEEWQWLSPESAAVLQLERLERLLTHAYEKVPYYRDVLVRAGVAGSTKKIDLNNFKHIPLLDKYTIRSRFNELKSSSLNNNKWFYNFSGGSTGETIKLIQDSHYEEWVNAIQALYDQWACRPACSPQIRLWGSERDLYEGSEKTKSLVARWLRNEIWLNAFRMTTSQMYSYIEKINRHRPSQVLAYVDSIYELARLAEHRQIRVYSPRAVMVTAGTLNSHMRETIERVFRCPVFNRYGSREVGDIACECDHHKGLHVCLPNHYVEILRPDGSPADRGETGEIVVTPLVNYAMPLIRYRIGDTGSWSKNRCSCGRGWPLLENVFGRLSDNFFKRDGTSISGLLFEQLLMGREWIEKFQVIQEDYELVRILIVPYDRQRGINRQEAIIIADKIRFVMGQECRVQVEVVEEIPPTPSGKYRYLLSKIFDLHYQRLG